MPVLLISLLLLAVTGFALWLARSHRYKLAGYFAALPPLIITIWQLTQLGPISHGQFPTERYAWATQVGLEISLRMDGLAVFFGLIVTGIGAAVALYTAYYFEHEERQGYFYLLLFAFMASMLGLVWSDNLLTLFVFWEGTSITSYLLIAFKYYDREAKEGGRRAFIVTGLGGLAMLVGILLLGQEAGTYTISELVAFPDLAQSPIYPAALLLILLGAFTKSAQFPFHFWLPGAMAAPTPASAYLHSATMVKAGVFLLARLHPALSHSSLWFWSLLLAGGATMLLGAVSAFRYHDLKALLANATLSQLGILVMLLAFQGKEMVTAVVVGVLAHALYKGPLFLVAGIIDHATGTRDMRRFAKLGRALPWVTVAAVLAGVSMAGFPPMFGFLAKETLLETTYHFMEYESFWLGAVLTGLAAITGALFVGYSLTMLWETFFRREATLTGLQGDDATAAHVHHAPSFSFVLGPLLLTLIGTMIPFVLAQVEEVLFSSPASSILGEEIHLHLKLWHGFTPVLMVSLAAIATGIGIFFIRTGLRHLLEQAPASLNGVYIFNRINDGVYGFATWVTRRVQGGTMGQQLSIILVAAFAMVAAGLLITFRSGTVSSLAIIWTARPEIPEAIIALLTVISAVSTVRARSRLGAIISLGVVGVTVTLFFIFFSAPDLALTQLLIEVLTVVLLVLVFYRVQPDRLLPLSTLRKTRNLVVAFAMGIFGFTLVLLSNAVQVGESISQYFLYYGVPEGKGGNIVNVILVDFRGYDTMGEITVLGIAAVGGYALLRAPRLQVLRRRLRSQMVRMDQEPAASQLGEGEQQS